MKIDPRFNSQILGSSVMVVNLFHSQDVKFTEIEKGGKGKCVDIFVTEHCSAYIMNCWDDLALKHHAEFKGRKKGKVRMAIVYRWLGRRTSTFCGDYKYSRQNCEIFTQPNKHVAKDFPNCKKARDNFSFSKTKPSIFPPTKMLSAVASLSANNDDRAQERDEKFPSLETKLEENSGFTAII